MFGPKKFIAVITFYDARGDIVRTETERWDHTGVLGGYDLEQQTELVEILAKNDMKAHPGEVWFDFTIHEAKPLVTYRGHPDLPHTKRIVREK
jgi:hypothetical protein